MTEIQEETGDIFNLEATPAEGTSFRLAMLDKSRFPEIICANESDVPKGCGALLYQFHPVAGPILRRPLRNAAVAGQTPNQIYRRHGPSMSS